MRTELENALEAGVRGAVGVIQFDFAEKEFGEGMKSSLSMALSKTITMLDSAIVRNNQSHVAASLEKMLKALQAGGKFTGPELGRIGEMVVSLHARHGVFVDKAKRARWAPFAEDNTVLSGFGIMGGGGVRVPQTYLTRSQRCLRKARQRSDHDQALELQRGSEFEPLLSRLQHRTRGLAL